MEARWATIGHAMLHAELILLAQLAPILLLLVWQYEDDLQVAHRLAKPLQRMHQHRSTADELKLLRHVATHTQALSARHNDYVVHYFKLRVESSFSISLRKRQSRAES